MRGVQQISQSELEIMDIIWKERSTITLAPLMEKLGQIGKRWKTNTVVTFLARLAEKGLLSIEKRGRNNVYIANVGEQDYLESQTKAFLIKNYANDAKELVASLLRHEYLTADEIEEIAEYWKKRRIEK